MSPSFHEVTSDPGGAIAGPSSPYIYLDTDVKDDLGPGCGICHESALPMSPQPRLGVQNRNRRKSSELLFTTSLCLHLVWVSNECWCFFFELHPKASFPPPLCSEVQTYGSQEELQGGTLTEGPEAWPTNSMVRRSRFSSVCVQKPHLGCLLTWPMPSALLLLGRAEWVRGHLSDREGPRNTGKH